MRRRRSEYCGLIACPDVTSWSSTAASDTFARGSLSAV